MRFEPLAVADKSVFVLTGAGISAESGIKTFRDAGGMWEEHRFEDVASPEGWERDASLVWKFYSQRRAQALECKPNAAHHALAELERAIGDRLFVCTQNVDPLHEAAGSKSVCHMHGELLKTRCEDCDRAPFYDEQSYVDRMPKCECGSRLRPHICWFGEVPFDLDLIAEKLNACDVFLTVGSSGVVYPAAGFVRAVKHRSRPAYTIYVGPEVPDNAAGFDECRIGKAGEVMPSLFAP
jgi:NAD-dependent deacetylase